MSDKKKNAELLAIALAYDKTMDPAPRIVAKGQDELARRIIEVAEEHGIEIHKDADLAEILSVLELDSYIPLEAYVAVAEVLSYLYRQQQQR